MRTSQAPELTRSVTRSKETRIAASCAGQSLPATGGLGSGSLDGTAATTTRAIAGTTGLGRGFGTMLFSTLTSSISGTSTVSGSTTGGGGVLAMTVSPAALGFMRGLGGGAACGGSSTGGGGSAAACSTGFTALTRLACLTLALHLMLADDWHSERSTSLSFCSSHEAASAGTASSARHPMADSSLGNYPSRTIPRLIAAIVVSVRRA